jgi:hypothetical protein
MSTPEAAPPKKAGVPASRIILLVVLVAAIVALVLDFRARGQMNAAHEKADKLLDQDDSPNVNFVKPEDVQKALNRKPDSSKPVENGLVETYSWGGVFYKYNVVVRYGGSEKSRYLSGVEKNSVSRFAGQYFVR